MPYNEFTFDLLRERFGIIVRPTTGAFAGIPPVPVRESFRENLVRDLPLGVGLGTEKARSEFLIAPLLAELRGMLNGSISVFSGAELNVDRATGLYGFCDFLISRDPNVIVVEAPIVTVVEAKREDLNVGIAQCIAEMVAVARFNRDRGHPLAFVYGTVTIGSQWRFLRLVDNIAETDLQEFSIEEPDKIMGILLHMIQTSVAAPTGTGGATQETG